MLVRAGAVRLRFGRVPLDRSATVGRGARDMPPERGGRADETRPERMSGPIASLIYIKQCSGKRNIAWMRHSDA